MKQVIQSLRTGETELVETPCPPAKPRHLLIRTATSLISAGTERMLLDFGKANLLQKARQHPEKVRMVLDKVRTDGLLPTIETVRNKLDQSIPTGYCNVGTVIACGDETPGFEVGDRVISNGYHAEVVCVPRNLCAKVPATVSEEAAAFTVIGSIALQGIRLAKPTIGETFAVTGLGLVGLLTVQILRAHGCKVLGIDFDPKRLELARQFGATTVDLSQGEDPVAAANTLTDGRGIDGVLIAAATQSDEPIHQAADMCRKRGRIVLIGVTGMQLSRADFYEKELSFQVSCSYGPGRYDSDYETFGHDYPLGYVRWTEQRNFEAVLDLLADGRIDVEPVVTHRFQFEQAQNAFDVITGSEPSLGVVLKYREQEEAVNDDDIQRRTVRLKVDEGVGRQKLATRALPGIGFIGAGNFATGVLIPAFKQGNARLEAVASDRGLTSVLAARKFGFASASSAPYGLLKKSEIDAVVIATRHDTHADFVCRALEAGKHVFVEKPLALNHEQLDRIVDTYESIAADRYQPTLMVGFNRRFAPTVQKAKQLLGQLNEPKCFVMTVNAGALPADHWCHDPKVGGGRIIGEGCHFIDLMRYLCGSKIVSVQATMVGKSANTAIQEDKMSFALQFADGSIGTVHYLGNGHRSFPKERVEIFCAGRVIQIDNFRKLKAFGFSKFDKMKLWRQDKGHSAEVAEFLAALTAGKPSPIPFDELVEVTRVSFDVVKSAMTGEPIRCSTGHSGLHSAQSQNSASEQRPFKRSA